MYLDIDLCPSMSTLEPNASALPFARYVRAARNIRCGGRGEGVHCGCGGARHVVGFRREDREGGGNDQLGLP